MIELKTIDQVKNFNDKKFQKTFATMIEILQKQYRESHKKCGRPPKVTMFDRLCIFFAYYRDGRTIADIANDYSIAESTTFDIMRLVEDTLLADERFHLPSKRALLKENIEIAVVDCSIQRPKKTKKMLFRQKETSYLESSTCNLREKNSVYKLCKRSSSRFSTF